MMKRLLLAAAGIACLSTAHSQLAWEKTYQISPNPGAFTILEAPAATYETADHGFLVAGVAKAADNNNFGYLLKVNANGDSLWCKKYIGNGYNRVAAIFRDNSNDLIAVFEKYIGAQHQNLFFVKIDETTGDSISGFMAPKPNSADGYQYKKHIQLADGSYVVIGQIMNGASAGSGFMLRFTPGNTTNTWYADSLAQRVSIFNDILLDNNGIIVAGTNGSINLKQNFYVARYSLEGKTMWQRTLRYPGEWAPSTAAYAIRKNSDGNYVVAGDWAQIIANVSTPSAAVGIIGSNGDSIALNVPTANGFGSINDLLEFNGKWYGSGVQEHVVKAPDNSNQNVRYLRLFQVGQHAELSKLEQFSKPEYYVSGGGYLANGNDAKGMIVTSDNKLLMFGSGTTYQASAFKTQKCTYLVKFGTQVTGINEAGLEGKGLRAYPNPFSDALAVSTKAGAISRIFVYDVQGRLQASEPADASGTTLLQTSSWPNGIYFLRCEGAAGTSTRKLVKAD